MANHPSAEKRNRQRIKRTARNRAVKGALRSEVKKVRVALLEGDATLTKAALKVAIVAISKAKSKGVLHRKTASRRISRLASKVSKTFKE